MKIVLLTVGKTSEKYLIEEISQFQKRVKHYCSFEVIEVPNIKNVKNLSILKMTFSHQMVQLFFIEQLYRAYTILSNEPYHHE